MEVCGGVFDVAMSFWFDVALGRVSVKVVPCSDVSESQIFCPCASKAILQKAKPRPFPC